MLSSCEYIFLFSLPILYALTPPALRSLPKCSPRHDRRIRFLHVHRGDLLLRPSLHPVDSRFGQVERQVYRVAFSADLVREHIFELRTGGELSSGLWTDIDDGVRGVE